MVRSQPPGRGSRMLPRRPRRSTARAISGSSTFRSAASSASRPKAGMGARRPVRRLAERPEVPQGRARLHRRLQARGCSSLDPKTGKLETLLETAYSEGFKGLNDLHFAVERRPLLHRPGPDRHRRSRPAACSGCARTARSTGCATTCRARTASRSRTTEKHCYVGVTRSQLGVAPADHGATAASRRPASRSSSRAASAGPTASRWTRRTACSCATWASASGASTPTCCRRTSSTPKAHTTTTSTTCAFGGPDLKTLYITEALSGDILMAKMPVAGKQLYGLQ